MADGRREAAGFLAVPWVARGLREALGVDPYPGTLNLRIPENGRADWEALQTDPEAVRLDPPAGSGFCAATLVPVWIEGTEPGGIILPHVDGYDPAQVEVVAAGNLRDRFGLGDGDPVRITPRREVARPFDAVLFDLEGTLVDFQWRLDDAEGDLRAAVTALGLDPAPFAADDYAAIHRRAHRRLDGEGRGEAVDRALGPIYDRYDLDALSRWTPRPGALELLGDLRAGRLETALVSNIGRKGVDGALTKFGLRGLLGRVVTRNHVARMKPAGDGIRLALDDLGCSPDRALMVGDSLSDLGAARDAGVRVALVTGGQTAPEKIRAAGPDHLLADLPQVLALV